MQIPPVPPNAGANDWFPPRSSDWQMILGYAKAIADAMTQNPAYPGGAVGAKILKGDEMDSQFFKSVKEGLQNNIGTILGIAETCPWVDSKSLALVKQLDQNINSLTPQSSLADFVRVAGESSSLYLIATRAYSMGQILNDSAPLETTSNLSELTSAMSDISDPKSAKGWQEAVTELSNEVGTLSSLQSSFDPNDYNAFHEAWQNWMSGGQEPSSMGHMIQALQQLRLDFLMTQ